VAYYLKVGYEIRDYGNNSLSTEKYIYDSVVPGMVRQGPAFISGKRMSTKETATIMATIRTISDKDVTIHMNNQMLTITDALLGQRRAVISELTSGETTKAKRSSIEKMVNEVIILTERKCCKGTTTLQAHNENKNTKEDDLMILIQLIWALHVLWKNGVRHNDLHFNNILVENVNVEAGTHYLNVGSGTYIKVRCQYRVRIFDYDRSTQQSFLSLHENTHLRVTNLCSAKNICHSFATKRDQNYDWMTIMRWYKETLSTPRFDAIMRWTKATQKNWDQNDWKKCKATKPLTDACEIWDTLHTPSSLLAALVADGKNTQQTNPLYKALGRQLVQDRPPSSARVYVV
jgi:hypothetical protein